VGIQVPGGFFMSIPLLVTMVVIHLKAVSPALSTARSYTSARDFFNIQGATYSTTPIPSQEVLGIIHQSPEPFTNDAVTTIMRGHLFLPLYINPAFMDGTRWKMIADIIIWAKNNASLIQNTKVLLREIMAKW